MFSSRSSIARLRACCVTQAQSGFAVTPARWTRREPRSIQNSTYSTQPDSRDTEEVAGQHPLRLRVQELRPGRAGSPRGRTPPMPSEERADRGRAHPDPELAQLALDADAVLARILPRQPQHQLPELGVKRRPARQSAPIRPLSAARVPAASAEASAATPRTRATAGTATGRWPQRAQHDPFVATPAASPTAAARSTGVATPRSRPQARQQQRRRRRVGQIVERAVHQEEGHAAPIYGHPPKHRSGFPPPTGCTPFLISSA